MILLPKTAVNYKDKKLFTYQIVEDVCEGPGRRCIEERDAQNHQMTNSYE